MHSKTKDLNLHIEITLPVFVVKILAFWLQLRPVKRWIKQNISIRVRLYWQFWCQMRILKDKPRRQCDAKVENFYRVPLSDTWRTTSCGTRTAVRYTSTVQVRN